jgi:hypothetical protein
MGTEYKASATQRRSTWAVTLARLAVVALLIILANIGISWFIDRLEIQIWPEHMERVDRAVLIGVILYIGLMAMPFLPGIELGLILMVILGPKGVLVTYVCTLIALTISFGLGRILPAHPLVSLLRWLHLTRAASLLKTFDATPPENRLAFLSEKAPAQAIPALLKHRYLLLALLFNLPGNALIGGGGGIAMMAGMSRIYSFPAYLLLIAVAILPGPILILLSKLIP